MEKKLDSQKKLHGRTLLLLALFISIAFGSILWPFYGTVFWAVAFCILFSPLQQKILKIIPQQKNLSSALTVLIFLLIVILPFSIFALSLSREANQIYQAFLSGNIRLEEYLHTLIQALPTSAKNFLERLELSTIKELKSFLYQNLSSGIQQITSRAFLVGRNAFEFFISFAIMLYLLFFLLRDGASIAKKVQIILPLDAVHSNQLANKFSTVIRATIKGSIVIAVLQGLLGALVFSILGIQGSLVWGIAMAVLSLLPGGPFFILLPVSLYFFATGLVMKGVVLTVSGLFIGTIDNFLRPILVCKETHTPDYLVLLSTLGGMSLFGLNGFVIGPIITSLFIAVWDLLSQEKSNTQ